VKAVTVVVGDVHPDASPELPIVRKSDAMNDVGLQRVEEGFSVGIVTRRAAARHALVKSETPQTLTKEPAAIFAPAVAMEDEPPGWLAPPYSEIEGRSSESTAAPARHAPPDNASRELVDDHR
jgi:hypothetical protein